MQADLNSGTIDAAVGLPLAQIDTLEKDPALTIVRGTPWGFKNLAFNCYDSPNSQGNPVLRDAAFRRALNWAIDREKIASVAFFGEAQPGSSLLPPYSSAHYAVPDDQLYTYDPEKAKTELDAAGYKDVNGDGVRETKDGKPLDLRFFVATDSSENQTAAKMMAGWLKDVGVKVTMEMMDTSALLDAIYTYKGDTYAPDFDMFVWQWTYDPDPTSPLAILCTWNIEGWSDTLWSNAEYDKLFDEQDQELDPAKRDQIGQAMQRIAYEESPYIIFVYHTQMEAYRSDKWQGVVPSPSDIQGFDGAAFYNYMNIDTYRFVTPKLGAPESSGANTTALAGVGIVAGLAVLGIVLLVVKRRRSRSVEE
jgi:peptide/nickel transport system substrate-binding protein